MTGQALPDEVVALSGASRDARRRERYLWIAASTAVTIATLGVVLGVASRLYLYEPIPLVGASSEVQEQASGGAKELDKFRSGARQERLRLAALAPSSVYIVVDTGQNRLYVKRGDKVLHEAVCSTWSGGLLEDPESGRQWTFKTPRGSFHVVRKVEDPVWTKPDWAFVEEGKPVPDKWSERRDPNTLGDYALYIGDGYMIHGTLYQRYLGRSVTHGCVRLGDEDLDRVYHLTPVGTPVFIF